MDLIRVCNSDRCKIIVVKDKEKAIKKLDKIKVWTGIDRLREAEKVGVGIVQVTNRDEISDMVTVYRLY